MKAYNERSFVKINPKIIEWEWYKNYPVFKLFTHLLFIANWKDGKFEGMDIPRGSKVTSRKKLSDETGLSEQQVRTALSKLKSTNEITIKSTNRFMVINIVNYEKYQSKLDDSNQQDNQEHNQQITNEQPTDNQQITTIEEVKKYRSKDNNIYIVDSFFEEMWKLYPNKEGKKAVSKKSKEQIYKAGQDIVTKAINNYKSMLSRETWRKPMMGSTFFNGRYEDYLKEEETIANSPYAPDSYGETILSAEWGDFN